VIADIAVIGKGKAFTAEDAEVAKEDTGGAPQFSVGTNSLSPLELGIPREGDGTPAPHEHRGHKRSTAVASGASW